MFTGIVEAVGNVLKVENHHLTISRPETFDDLKIGASINVSGVCLSISDMTDNEMTFDVVSTTRGKTTLGNVQKGQKVNLERAISAGSRFDGHIVQGHTEGTATVRSVDSTQGDTMLTIEVPEDLLPYITEHGSIAIDGVSLTVAKKKGKILSIALVPLTLKNTTLGRLEADERVNIETDVYARTAARAAV